MSCDRYNQCVNHENCDICIDYSQFIGKEDIGRKIMSNSGKALLIICSIFGLICLSCVLGGLLLTDSMQTDQNKIIKNVETNYVKTNCPTSTITTNKITPTKKPKKIEYVFGSGNFYSGKDFKPGIYDLSAISGNYGNVISDNMFSGGINAIMGTEKGFAEQSYKNIELPDKTKLTIQGGVKIKLVKK